MIGDLPAISASSYASTAYAPGNLGGLGMWDNPTNAMNAQLGALPRRMIVGNELHNDRNKLLNEATIIAQGKKEIPVTRRLVQVFIADPDDNVPLDKALLYSGTQKFTDATDQELFFEIDIKSILDNYNDERVKIVNKKIKERTEMLDPVKIRDLKMTVVNIATF